MANTDDEEIQRLLELQRRELEILNATREFEQGETSDDDEYTDGTRQINLRPTVPDMRFEKQFERSVEVLKANGASNTTIFLSAVIKDQVVMQFITGFTWCLAGHMWKWYRLRGQRANNKESFVFLRGIKHGLARWATTTYHTLVNIPTISSTPSYPVT